MADGAQDHSSQASTSSLVTLDRWAPACDVNGPFAGDAVCAAAKNCPEGATYVRYNHWLLTLNADTGAVVAVAAAGSECRSTPPEAVPLVTPDMVRRAMERLPLPEPTVQVKPSPLTLVNFKTGFWVEVQAQTFDITLLGQQVQVRATPVSYAYDFGDGETLGPTEDAGTPYPHPSITHTYRDDGDVHAHVSVTYRGEFRVGGSGWAPVPGTVTVDGPPVQIQVRQAHAQLVS